MTDPLPPLRDSRLTRRALLAGVAGFSGLAAAGCLNPIPPAPRVTPTPAPPRVVVPIRLAHRQATDDITPYLFREEVRQATNNTNAGRVYQVTPTLQENPERQVAGLMAGDFDLVTLDVQSLGVFVANGQLRDVRVICGVITDGHPQYASTPFRTLATNAIARPADVRGRTVAAGPRGQTPDLVFRAWLRGGGLDPNRDVTWSDLPLNQIPLAVREGRVLLGPYPEPLDAIEAARGGLRNVFFYRDVLGPAERMVHVAKVEWLRVNEFAVRTFLADRARALNFVLGPGRAATIEAMARQTEVQAATYELYFATRRDEYRPLDGCLNLGWLQRPLDVLREGGAFESRVDARALVDASYLPGACG